MYEDLDFTLMEMNPFTHDQDGNPFPLDMRGELDDTAAFKSSKKWGPVEFPLPFGRTLTAAEEYVHGLDDNTGIASVLFFRKSSMKDLIKPRTLLSLISVSHRLTTTKHLHSTLVVFTVLQSATKCIRYLCWTSKLKRSAWRSRRSLGIWTVIDHTQPSSLNLSV